MDHWYEPPSVSAAKYRKLSAGSLPVPAPQPDGGQVERAAHVGKAPTTETTDSGTKDVRMLQDVTEDELLRQETTDSNAEVTGMLEDVTEEELLLQETTDWNAEDTGMLDVTEDELLRQEITDSDTEVTEMLADLDEQTRIFLQEAPTLDSLSMNL